MNDGKNFWLALLACLAVLMILVIITYAGAANTSSAKTAAQPPIPKAGPLAQPRSPQQVGLPVDQTQAVIPPDNPQTPEKIALGQKLFFDGRLSADGTVACASCHNPERAFTDGKPTSIGVRLIFQRLCPAIPELGLIVERVQNRPMGSAVNSIEMGQPNLKAAVARIAAVGEYERAFSQVFGRSTSGPDVLRAIASYERSLVSFNSPFDHFVAGDKNAIDGAAMRGWDLFNTQARCNKCHALTETKQDVTLFTDNDFHNIGIGIIRHNVVALARQAEQLVNSGDTAAIDRAALQTDMSALGRFLITKKESDIASFKTPGVRNVLVTGPYFHDGSQETLWDVIDHYNKGAGLQNPYLDEDIQPLALKENEIDDLVAFLASLTSDNYKKQGVKELARQRALSRTQRPQRDTARAFGPKPVQPKPLAP